MIKGKTESGFEFEANENSLKDMKYLRLLKKADENALYLDDAIVKILGSAQTEKLYEYLTGEDGIVPVEGVAQEFIDIITKAGEAAGDETKNS